jgi:hypothetical protein
MGLPGTPGHLARRRHRPPRRRRPRLPDPADAAGFRPLLVRRPGRSPTDGPTRVFLTDTAPPASRTTVLRVVDPAELAAIGLPATGRPLPGEPVSDPMLLVCTHGRRDRCCAVDGRALTRAVEAMGVPNVWECTHLGGHRFAPMALVLPTGYVYGRLDAAGALAAQKAAAVGEMEPASCRGRSTWSGSGQVAELAVRAATGLSDADALRVESESGAEVVRVVVTGRDGRWAVTVREAPPAATVRSPGVRPRCRRRRCAPRGCGGSPSSA